MSYDIEERKLGDLCIFNTGKLDSNAAEDNGIYPFFTCSPVTLNINNYAFDQDAILLAGNNAEGNFNIKYYSGRFNAYQRTYVISAKEPEESVLRYIYYTLSIALKHFKEISQGTATKFLTKRILDNFICPIPSLPIQRRIAAILASLDDKIENNHRTCEKLEGIAQEIFKQWFVNFEFPNEKGLPYKSSGGEMVYCEDLGKEIPKGWKIATIGDISEVVSKGTTPTQGDINSAKDETVIYYLKVKDIDDRGSINIGSLEKIPNSIHVGKLKRSIIKEKDIIVSIAGTIGRVAFIDKRLNNSNTNQALAFIRLKDKEKNLAYVLNYLKSEIFQNHISSSIVQAVQANISLGIIKDTQIIIPNENILDKYNQLAIIILDCIVNYTNKNEKLQQIRDALLPKLMSGEIEVEEGEK